MALIHEKLAGANRDIEAIAKARRNEQQGFRFRGIDDVYDAVHPILAIHGILTIPEVVDATVTERVARSGGAMVLRTVRVRYHFVAVDGSEIVATVEGEGMDSGDKATAKALSAAHKYALLQTFTIPVSEIEDPDAETPPEAVPDPLVTRAEREQLAARVVAQGVPPDAVRDWMRNEFHVESSAKLRGSQLVKVLEWLDSIKAETQKEAE
jgi:hypothetical protein